MISDVKSIGGARVAKSDPSRISFVKSDVTSASDWEHLVSSTSERYGHIDFLVNNAVISYKNKPSFEVTEKDFDLCFNANVEIVYLGTAAVKPKLIEQGRGGSVINVAGIGSIRPRPGLVWYNASKGAVYNVSLFDAQP